MKSARIKNCLWLAISISTALLSGNAAAQNARPIDVSKARVVDHWTSERRASAIPRDLVIDPRGLGYMRRPDGTLVPYGHEIAAQATQRNLAISPFGQSSGGDTTPPAISGMDPDGTKEIGASYTFKATVIDDSGVRSVTFKIKKDGSTVQSFAATKSAGDVWSVALQGFTDGGWSWWVEAKDRAAKGGNVSSTINSPVNFTVSTGGSGSTGDTVTNAVWSGGAVQTAAGRLYFEMPKNAQRTGPWQGYVCSGTVAADGSNTNGRSIIITAAHCVYDDVNKTFARNVMFIPDQADTTAGSKTDLNCGNDPLGCWIPSFGVVDVNWTTGKFPDNVAWDYAFYVVSDTGAHSTATTGIPSSTTDALDSSAGSLPVSFGTVLFNDGTTGKESADFTHALGYSYNVDPQFRYCAEDMTTVLNSTVNWWLPSCGLSGGSSGGPWVQKLVTDGTSPDFGRGPIISVNSWGYTNQPGMAGPKLVATTAERIFCYAKSSDFFSASDGAEGIIVSGSSSGCQ